MDDSETSVFPIAIRGYDRAAVDAFVHNARLEIAELEANQTREGAVQKAVDAVGVETASIIQTAHETANELTKSSRIEADDRVQQAQSEADQIRRDADEYLDQIVVDTRALWEERQRLIEDIRQLADQVLGTADEALERLTLPEPLAVEEAEAEPTTTEGPAAGPVGLPDDEPDALQSLAAVDDEPSLDDTAAWGVGEVEAEPPEGETGAYESAPEGERYEPEGFGEESLDAETAPYRIGTAAPEPPGEDSAPGPEEDSGHTVELEALPGGAGADDEPDPEPEPQPERSWDRERD